MHSWAFIAMLWFVGAVFFSWKLVRPPGSNCAPDYTHVRACIQSVLWPFAMMFYAIVWLTARFR